MRKKLSYVKQRLTEYARSLTGLRGRSGSDREVKDVGRGSKSRTIVLRERVWHIELSRRKIRRFFAQHKIAAIVTAALLGLTIFGRFALLSFASTADFYPSSCLGSWDNVQNALGKPDVGPGSSISSFTALNSAVFGTSSAQIFCGNFSGDTDISALEGKSFEKADLVLSWAFAFPAAAAPAPSGGGGGSVGVSESAPAQPTPPPSPADDGSVLGIDATSTGSASTTDAVTGDSGPSSTDDSASTSTNIVVVPPPDASTTAPSDSSDTTVTPPPDAISPPAPADAASSSPPANTASSSSPSDANTPTPAPDPAPAPAPAPAPDEVMPPPASSSQPTSLLRMLLDVAYADETSSAATAPATTAPSGDASATMSIASSSVEGIPAAPQPSAITFNTSMFQNIVLPSSKPGDIIGIVYSTDGTTWQPLQDINQSNWQDGRYAIPINSWDQLKHLQIAFIGLGDPSSPKIFLDAAGVEVSYDDPPQGTLNITPDTLQSPDDTTPPPPGSEPPPDQIIQKSSDPESDIFSQGATQKCDVAPFSQTVSPGTKANFSLQLFSGLTTPSSTPKAGAATSTLPYGYQHAIYDTRLGSLPAGVAAQVKDGPLSDVSSTQTITLQVGSGAVDGSFSLLVIYRERQDDASLRSTGCQLNLVVQ